MKFRNSSNRSTFRRGSRPIALTLILSTMATAALWPSSAFADCVKSFERFKVCPEDLPPVPDFALLCADGCYLFHPDDERAARFNATRVKLIPELTVKLEEFERVAVELRSQRDQAIRAYKDVVGVAGNLAAENDALVNALGEAPDFTTVVVVVVGGFAVGLAVGAIAVAFLSP